MAKIEYKELCKAKVSDSRNVVISTCSKGGFTIAQQLEVAEGGKVVNVFMKNAIHIDGIEGLYNTRDAINMAIAMYKEQKKQDEENEWDEESDWS